MSEETKPDFNRKHDEYEQAVMKWLPAGSGPRKNEDGTYNIVTAQGYGFPDASTVEEAWKNAFTAMQEVNAYYLWKNSGGLGSAFENWIDGGLDIENGPYVPNPNIPPIE